MRSALDIALRLPASFWERVSLRGECWTWIGAFGTSGYGLFKFNRRTELVHRLAYSMLVGAIPEGLHIDHLCRARDCVNPAHLEPVTCGENTRRSTAPEAARKRHAAVTHCPRGHGYTAENTKFRRGRGYDERLCSECRRADGRQYMQKKRAERKAQSVQP